MIWGSSQTGFSARYLHGKGTMPMDDDILRNHILVVASHLHTIFDESIEQILQSDIRRRTQGACSPNDGVRPLDDIKTSKLNE